MRILIIVDCYLPVPKSSAKLVDDLARELARVGHETTVLAPDDDLAVPLTVADEGGLRVVRVRTGQIKGAPRVVRGWREATLSETIWMRASRFFEVTPHDAIVFYSPSIFFGKLVRRLKSLWRCRAYLILRDIFPQWALDAGVLRRGPAYYYLKAVELAQYAAADIVGVQSPANLRYFDRVPVRPPKIEVLYNWGQLEVDSAQPTTAMTSALNGKLVFFFGGNMGVAQDMDAVVRLAAAMKGRRDVGFLLVGEGSEFSRLAAAIGNSGLTNIRLLPAVPQHQYFEMLSLAHVGLITLNGKLKTQNIPGKLLGYLRAGLPVLASLNPGNDLATILSNARAGLCATAGDDATLRGHALTLANNPLLRAELGANARILLRTTFSVEAAARQILSHFAASFADADAEVNLPVSRGQRGHA